MKSYKRTLAVATITILALAVLVAGLGFCSLAGIAAVLFERVLRRLYPDLDEWDRVTTTFLFSLATLWFFYSSSLEHRILSSFFCFAAYAIFLSP